MTLLFLAVLLPSVFWDGGTDTAPALREAQIHQIAVPPAKLDSWKGIPGISAEAADVRDAVKLPLPGVNYRLDTASASSAPWVNSNGWRFLRKPEARYYYDAPGRAAALAAAEAYAYGASAMIRADEAGLKPLGQMLAFLKSLNDADLPALANIGYIDDGTPQSGELLNLLIRRNLLVKIIPAPDPHLDLTVKFGSKEYPKAEAADPSRMEQKVRTDLTDQKRLLRIYGSEVVIGRLTGTDSSVRLHLLNYAAAFRPVQGVRVRVLGSYPTHHVAASGVPDAKLMEYSVSAGATEFTLPLLMAYAVIDLSR